MISQRIYKINCPLTFFFLFGFIYLSCNYSRNQTPKKIGDKIVFAHFDKDGFIQGWAKFYNQFGQLESEGRYVDNVNDGVALTYYPNGQKKDSIFYISGKKSGNEYNFDSVGNLSSSSYQYFGIKMGPQIIYELGKPSKFFFIGFAKEELVECSYDSAGNFNSCDGYRLMPSVFHGIEDGKKVLNLFCYLPRPPKLKVDFILGIQDTVNLEKKILCNISSQNAFLDTILPYPPKGLNYYISSHVKASNTRYNKVFEEIIVSDQ